MSFETLARKFARLVIKLRWLILIWMIISTFQFLYQFRNIKIYHSLDYILPLKHPFVKLHKHIAHIFGGTNQVAIAIKVKEGTVLDPPVLKKIHRITDKIQMLHGVSAGKVISIASRKLKHVWVTKDPEGYPLIHIKSLKELVERVQEGYEKYGDDYTYIDHNFYKNALLRNDRIYGPMLSQDLKGTVVVAEFEWESTYRYTFEKFKEIVAEEADPNIEYYIGGRQIELGYLHLYMKNVLYIFGAASVVILLFLWLSFGTLRGIALPFTAAMITVIWDWGLAGLLRIKMDIMSSTVPFLIMSIETSHAVQIMKRYYEEFAKYGNREKAIEETVAGLLKPALAAIITDSMGFATLLLLPFRMMRSMSFMATMGILRMIITTVITMPAVLAILPPPSRQEMEKTMKAGILDRLLRNVGYVVFGKGRWVVFAGVVAVFIASLIGRQWLVVGDVQKGSPNFWENSTYNIDDHVLNEEFTGTTPYYIHINTGKEFGLHDPVVARDIDALAEFLKNRPEVGYMSVYTDIIKSIYRSWFDGKAEYYRIPDEERMIYEFCREFYDQGDPEDTRSLFTPDYTEGTIQIFLKDHRSSTLKGIIRDTEEWIKKNKKGPEEIRVAGGHTGLFAAIIETIERLNWVNRALITAGIYTACVITFRSFLAGLFLLIPLLLGTLVTEGTMGFMNIGLFLYTLPVAAMGMGLGVDYGIYVMERLKEEYREDKDIKSVFGKTMVTSGKAVSFTAISVMCGTVALGFSNLKFQAMMGAMLSMTILCNMLGALLFLTSMIAIVKPKFLFAKEKEEAVETVSLPRVAEMPANPGNEGKNETT